MIKRIILLILVLVNLLLFSSCDKIRDGSGRKIGSEEKQADARMEQIISAIKNKDRESLKSLFSKKALGETDDFEGGVDSLFNFIQGDIESWKRDGFASDESMEYGKRSWMIRFGFTVKTDKDVYQFFVIDYNVDTINTDNQGVYMLELIDNYGERELESWQDRMRAGIYIH
jgi:hypothetical protein